jgi:hypothetical protein
LSADLSLRSSDFHETHICSVSLSGNNLHEIAAKLVIKYGNYTAKLSLPLGELTATDSMFMKLMLASQPFAKDSSSEFHEIIQFGC